MTLARHGTLKGVKYDPDFFDADTIENLASLRADVRPQRISFARTLRYLGRIDLRQAQAGALYDEQATRSALQEALAVARQDGELAGLIEKAGEEKVLEEGFASLSKKLRSPVGKKVAAHNESVRKRLALTVSRGTATLRFDRQPILTMDLKTASGASLQVIVQIALVFLDVMFILASALQIMVARQVAWAEQIVRFFGRIKQTLIDFGMRFIKACGAMLSGWRTAAGSGRLAQAVKDTLRPLVAVIVDCLKWGWNTKGFSDCVIAVLKLMFSGRWYRKLLAVVQLTAGILLLIATAGTSLIAAVLGLVANVAYLVIDSIKLADMFAAGRGPISPSRVAASQPLLPEAPPPQWA